MMSLWIVVKAANVIDDEEARDYMREEQTFKYPYELGFPLEVDVSLDQRRVEQV